jgi:hypothetical protein
MQSVEPGGGFKAEAKLIFDKTLLGLMFGFLG